MLNTSNPEKEHSISLKEGSFRIFEMIMSVSNARKNISANVMIFHEFLKMMLKID